VHSVTPAHLNCTWVWRGAITIAITDFLTVRYVLTVLRRDTVEDTAAAIPFRWSACHLPPAAYLPGCRFCLPACKTCRLYTWVGSAGVTTCMGLGTSCLGGGWVVSTGVPATFLHLRFLGSGCTQATGAPPTVLLPPACVTLPVLLPGTTFWRSSILLLNSMHFLLFIPITATTANRGSGWFPTVRHRLGLPATLLPLPPGSAWVCHLPAWAGCSGTGWGSANLTFTCRWWRLNLPFLGLVDTGLCTELPTCRHRVVTWNHHLCHHHSAWAWVQVPLPAWNQEHSTLHHLTCSNGWSGMETILPVTTVGTTLLYLLFLHQVTCHRCRAVLPSCCLP